MYTTSLEGESRQYRLKVMSTLLTQAIIAGVPPEDLVEFFAIQIQSMLMCPPNIRKDVETKIWVLRGFYPDTPLFFKLTLCDGRDNLYAKASPLETSISRGAGTSRWPMFVVFDGNQLNESLTDKMENELLGAKHDIKKVVEQAVRMPRCMSPKGMKLFKFKKKKAKNSGKTS